MSGRKIRRVRIPIVVLALTFLACKPGPGGPCAVDAAKAPPAPEFPAEWDFFEMPQPPGAWIGNVALSPNGRQLVYANALAGHTIPTGEGVSLIRVDLAPEMNHTLVELPGPALRNQAALAWSIDGVAWASWSTIGVSQPKSTKVKVLHRLAGGPPESRPMFPLFNSVVWAPGGDCIGATIENQAAQGELIAWKAKGASTASFRLPKEPLERAHAWTGDGILLVANLGTSGRFTARWVTPDGVSKEGVPPPNADGWSWLGGEWLTVSREGVVKWGEKEVAKVPKKLKVEDLPKPQKGTAEEDAVPEHRFHRVLAAESGRALVVEEGVQRPGHHLRYIHVLTPKAP